MSAGDTGIRTIRVLEVIYLSTTEIETYELRFSYKFTITKKVQNGEKLANYES